MGRVGATAIRSVGGFCFIVVVFLLRLIVAFHGCSPSIHDDVREFLATFG